MIKEKCLSEHNIIDFHGTWNLQILCTEIPYKCEIVPIKSISIKKAHFGSTVADLYSSISLQ